VLKKGPGFLLPCLGQFGVFVNVNGMSASKRLPKYLSTSTLFMEEAPQLIVLNDTRFTALELLPKITNSDFSWLGISRLA